MTSAQIRGSRPRIHLLVASGAVLAMGIYVELAEGLTGQGHCRLRDLVPDLAGAVVGAVLLMLWKLIQKHRGSTGNASPKAPHLHFSIFVLGPQKRWWQGTAINPYPLLMAGK